MRVTLKVLPKAFWLKMRKPIKEILTTYLRNAEHNPERKQSGHSACPDWRALNGLGFERESFYKERETWRSATSSRLTPWASSKWKKYPYFDFKVKKVRKRMEDWESLLSFSAFLLISLEACKGMGYGWRKIPWRRRSQARELDRSLWQSECTFFDWAKRPACIPGPST